MTTYTADQVSSKLEKVELSTRTTAREYINEFQQYVRLLEQLNESFTESYTVSMFLRQITDPDYEITKTLCIEEKLHIGMCIDRIRARERRLPRERNTKKKSYLNIRRDQVEPTVGTNSNEIDIEKYKNERGFYSIPYEIWNTIGSNDQDEIKKINGQLRRKRKREDKRNGSSITPRRSEHSDASATPSPPKKQRTVQIQDESSNKHEGGRKKMTSLPQDVMY